MNIRKSFIVALCLSCWILTSAFAGDLIVKVAPPNGTDDTAAIQAALDQCVAHGPGCTVQLDAGIYRTTQLLANNLHGTFKGKGMDVTIIQALPLVCNMPTPVFDNPPSKNNPYPIPVLFFEGDITVSDMTLRAPEIIPVPGGWVWGEIGGGPYTFLWSILEFMGTSPMNVVVNRVALEGINDPGATFDYYNSSSGISFDGYPPCWTAAPGTVQGVFRVSASRVMKVPSAIWAFILSAGQLTIGGSPKEGNLIKSCEAGAWVFTLDNSTVDFSYNDVSVAAPDNAPFGGFTYGGLVAVQSYPAETPTTFLIQHNRIRSAGHNWTGIWLLDESVRDGLGKKADALISDNAITLDSAGSPPWAGIEATFLEDAVINKNRIEGNSTIGISLEGASNCLVKGNNVQNVDAILSPIALLTLGELPTHYCTVVGGHNRDNVYSDPGAYDNTLVGVNNMHGNPPGPAIRDAMKRKMEMIKSMRKP